jgi:tRNA nucleotidyltransferase (CCA-adding enzyme)
MKWAQGKEPKDILEAPVPFIYDVDKDNIAFGQPGQRTSDIQGEFTPGGIVEGEYQPGGNVLLTTDTNMPYTTRHLLDLFKAMYPHMEVTGVEREMNGQNFKIASERRIMYHIAPQSARPQILERGLEPRWGGGQSTGQTPFAGTNAPLRGVYLSDYPGLIGLRDHSPFENLTGGPHDIWEVNVEGLPLHPDFPALGEHGAVAEPSNFWFDDDAVHEQTGGLDAHDYEQAISNPEPYIQLTGTALHPNTIPPERLRLRDISEFGPGKPMPYTSKLSATSVGNYVKQVAATDPAVWQAYQALKTAGGQVYAVGGAVLSALLQKEPNDIDLMVTGLPPEQVEHVLNGLPGRMDFTGKSFGVYRYKTKGHEVEIALPRTEKSTGNRRVDFAVNVDHNLPVESDLLRRDFTINSMAVDLGTGRLVDPFHGAEDLAENRLRTTHPASFDEDPTRVLRALVMNARYGVHPDEQTRGEMSSYAHRLKDESWDNMQGILDKLFKAKDPARAIRLAQETGVLQHVFPEVSENFDFDQNNPHHSYPLGDHLLNVLENTQRESTDPDLRLAALLHDIGKPASAWTNPETGFNHYYLGPNGEGADHAMVGATMAEARMRALRYPVSRSKRVRHLIEHHMWPAFDSPKGARKFINRVGDEHADDLLTLRHADQFGKGQSASELAARTSVDRQRGLVEQVRSAQQPTSQSGLFINGNDIIALGIKPGPTVGRILRYLTDEVVSDPALNNREALLQMAQEYVNAQ